MSGQSKYSDIIDLEHHTSSQRPRMSAKDRAAQFSPFAALTGYGDVINETGRLTDEEVALTVSEIENLNRRLQAIIYDNPDAMVNITYFAKDERKSGGAYLSFSGKITRYDPITATLYLQNGTQIPVDSITAIESEIFNVY